METIGENLCDLRVLRVHPRVGGSSQKLMEIQKVGVLGCGLMGSGIAQVAAQAGYDVTVLEAEQKALDKGFAGIDSSLAKFVERGPEKGGITAAQRDQIRARLKGTQKKEDLAGCDIVSKPSSR